MTRDDERPELPNPMVCSVLMISYLILDFLTPHDFLRYFSTSVKTVLIETFERARVRHHAHHQRFHRRGCFCVLTAKVFSNPRYTLKLTKRSDWSD